MNFNDARAQNFLLEYQIENHPGKRIIPIIPIRLEKNIITECVVMWLETVSTTQSGVQQKLQVTDLKKNKKKRQSFVGCLFQFLQGMCIISDMRDHISSALSTIASML